MNEMLVYESNASDASLLWSLLFYAAFVAIGFFVVYKTKNMEGKSKYLFPLIIGSMLFFWTIGEGISMYGNYRVLKAFEKNEYLVVDGIITKFHENPKIGHQREYFFVDKVYFELHNEPKKLNTLFYSKERVWGGLIRGNGQKVKIYYIEYLGENKIIKMWVEKEADKNTTKEGSGQTSLDP